MLKAAFTTLGCKVNQCDTEKMIGLFKARGYEIIDFSQKADVYVINTCSVTRLSERKSRQMISKANRLSPEAIIVVTGCYAQASAEEMAKVPAINIIAGTSERGRIVDLVEEYRHDANKKQITRVFDLKQAGKFEDIPLLFTPGRTRSFLKIQDGCENYCSYCIIPHVRGPLRSRPVDSILAEAGKLVEAGFKEIVLTGIHLGAYGRDLGEGQLLAGAVKEILGLKGLLRLRLGSLESVEVSDELVEIMEQDIKLCQHLHLPLQSGDNDILKAMNRHYTSSYYRDMVEKIRHKIPDIAVTTDIIVGFPGETEKNFANTLKFVEALNFARVHVFPYSRREGTLAANYKNQIGGEVKKQRVQILNEVAAKKAFLFQSSFIGQRLEVLFENFAKNTDADAISEFYASGEDNKGVGIIEGLTGNYMRVYAEGNADFLGKPAVVEIQNALPDKLWGKIIKN